MRTFFPAMCPAFFMRVSPASRKAKPACMNITRTAVITTQTVDTAISSSCRDIELHLLEPAARPMMSDAPHGRDPAQAVARLVAASGGVGDRLDDIVDHLVGDDEDEHRLRQEPRLEDAAPVLVRDAALAAVPDRLDHRDADVARRLLDGVDHRLDALPDDYGFDLVHQAASASSTAMPRSTVWIVCRIRP